MKTLLIILLLTISSFGATLHLPNQAISGPSELPFTMKGTDDILAFQFEVNYDPALLEPYGANFGCSTEKSIAFEVNCNVTEAGVLRVSSFGIFPITEEGVLLRVNWMPLKMGASYLYLTNAGFFNANGYANVDYEDGTIVVQ